MRLAASARPFTVAVEEAVLADLQERLADTRWPAEPADAGWRYGSSRSYMERLVAHWRTAYDWRHWEAALNRWPQYRAEIGGLDIHFICEPGSGERPLPLLLSHGWPGSVVEFYDIIDDLAHPERHGGDPADAFTVVCPSLPGYGFSAAPPAPLDPRQIASLWQALMTEVVGCRRYVAQAGDWGSVITSWLALRHPETVAAIHLNMQGVRPWTGPGTPPLDAEERDYLRRSRDRLALAGGYQEIQGTRPQSLAYALTDSPAGLAAWIVEKFHGWPGAAADQPPPFAMDRLITNVMLYWLGGINAANWLYWAARHQGGIALAEGERVTVPCGFAFFRHDLLTPPPPRWLARAYNVVHRRDFDHGGHFAAMENGPLLVEEMRRFFRPFRSAP